MSKYPVLSFLFLFLFIPFTSNTKAVESKKSNLIPLTNWQYLVVKSSDNSDAQDITIQNVQSSNDWKAISSLNNIPQMNNGKIIWLRTTLPDWKCNDPAIYVGQVTYSLQVFLNGKLISQWGSFSSADNKFIRWSQGVITLSDYKPGAEILFKVKPGGNFFGFNEEILFGSSLQIVNNIFRYDIVNFIFLAIILLTGIAALLIYFILQKTKLIFGLVLFLISLGALIASNTSFLQLIFVIPAVFYQMNYISINIASITFSFLIEQVVIYKYKLLINITWKIKLAFLLFLIIILNATNLLFFDFLTYFIILNLISIVIGIATLILSTRKRKFESRIFIFGMLSILASLVIEISLFFSKGMNSGFGYRVKALPFGAIIFVGTVIWLATHNYLETNREKEKSKQIEFEAVKRENEAKSLLASKLIESQEYERNRIALELHDSIGQKLLLIKNQLLSKIQDMPDDNTGSTLKSISDLTGETIHEIRNITYGLRPQYLDQLGLTAAIETIAEKVADTSEINFQINIDEIDEFFPKAHEINFFRIVQESLNNIVKHSKASEAFININREHDSLYMEIIDNGIGLPDAFNKNKSGIGLAGMQERAKIIGAKLEINKSKKAGTIVKLEYRQSKNE